MLPLPLFVMYLSRACTGCCLSCLVRFLAIKIESRHFTLYYIMLVFVFHRVWIGNGLEAWFDFLNSSKLSGV